MPGIQQEQQAFEQAKQEQLAQLGEQRQVFEQQAAEQEQAIKSYEAQINSPQYKAMQLIQQAAAGKTVHFGSNEIKMAFEKALESDPELAMAVEKGSAMQEAVAAGGFKNRADWGRVQGFDFSHCVVDGEYPGLWRCV